MLSCPDPMLCSGDPLQGTRGGPRKKTAEEWDEIPNEAGPAFGVGVTKTATATKPKGRPDPVQIKVRRNPHGAAPAATLRIGVATGKLAVVHSMRTPPLTPSPTYTRTHAPTHPRTHAPTQSLLYPPHSPTHSPTHPLAHSPTITRAGARGCLPSFGPLRGPSLALMPCVGAPQQQR